jgi:prepilin-type N-terminal cleavage/methylation domain-containing protein
MVRASSFAIPAAPSAGFTLIEMSMVLVIVGLLVGGILSGRDLIDAAEQRAQIAQINRYNRAARAFQIKYGYLPGDIPDHVASQFGFQPRGSAAGQGDGNGIIEAENSCSTSGSSSGYANGCGELAVFWQDLSLANLIDARICSGTGCPDIANNTTVSLSTMPTLKDWLPVAKIGQGTFVSLFSLNATNYFTVSAVTSLSWITYASGNPGITVQQAANIDSKIDDGLPQAGAVQDCYVNHAAQSFGWIFAAGNEQVGASGGNGCVPTKAPTPYAATNCYDNNGVAGPQKYSLAQNANIPNCALSFKFQ